MTEKRIPKVGEVWTDRFCSDNRVIEAVVYDRIYYTLGGTPYGQSLDRFLLGNNPPKPKPREAWVAYCEKCSDDPWWFAYPTKNQAEQFNPDKEIIHMREVREE